MTKQSKSLKDAMQGRNPVEMRQAITPIDILETERKERTEKPFDTTDSKKRTVTPNAQTKTQTKHSQEQTSAKKPNAKSERKNRSLLEEIKQPFEDEKRKTERYSFEIYTDQKADIEQVRTMYQKRTGRKLSASRIIREAIAEYTQKALKHIEE